MSLTSALYSGISGLTAQSKALASISSNIANSSTVGYKTTTTEFESYVDRSTFTTASTGGVLASNTRNISYQGEIQTSTTTTNIAINGSGYFVVADATSNGEIMFTRDGTFSTDDEGYLVNQEGNYLYAWPLDENGNITSANSTSTSGLVPVDLSDITGSPKATTSASIGANLPSDAEVGDDYAYDLEVFDSLGTSQLVTLTWTKTADNTWSMDASCDTGTLSGMPVTITFDGDGNLASTSVDPVTLGVTGWTSGASDSSISFDLGTVGGSDGLTQHASGEDEPDISVETVDQDGYAPGQIAGTTIDENGVVYATFDNYETRPIYKIPVATFSNPDGMSSVSGSTFQQTDQSGIYVLRTAGQDGAGEIQSSAVEASSVEITDEFSRMIVAQQAYTAASKVVTTAQDMIDTLLAIKR